LCGNQFILSVNQVSRDPAAFWIKLNGDMLMLSGKNRGWLATSAIAGSLLAAVPAQAVQIIYLAQLQGGNEIPAVTTNGFGNAILTIDTVLNTMRVQIAFTGLTGNTTAAHIHCCAVQPANFGVATTTPTFAGFPLGVTSGFYDSTLNMSLATSYSAAFLTANGGSTATAFATLITGLNNGQAYVNVHSTFAPGGEIRGTPVALVPEPATWGMMLLGFGLLGASMRRRPVVRTMVRYS
jgi:CHRD domain/PEP-CTERM motif